jgi:hypothetical protein
MHAPDLLDRLGELTVKVQALNKLAVKLYVEKKLSCFSEKKIITEKIDEIITEMQDLSLSLKR